MSDTSGRDWLQEDLHACQAEICKLRDEIARLKKDRERAMTRVAVLEDMLQSIHRFAHDGHNSATYATWAQKEWAEKSQYISGWLSTAKGFADRMDDAFETLKMKPEKREEADDDPPEEP